MRGSWGPETAPTSCLHGIQLTPEQELIRASAASSARASSYRTPATWDEAEELPRSLVGTLAEAGFLAASLPEELGGGGLDSVSYCLLCEELGQGRLVGARDRLGLERALRQDGREVGDRGAEEELLPRLASGEGLGCYALTEPGCGSDAAALATRAEQRRRRWVLTGSKVFITLGSWAETAIVFARTGGPGRRESALSSSRPRPTASKRGR